MNNSKETENFVPEEKFKKLMEILKAELNSQRILDRWTDPEGRNGCPSCTVHESREGDNVIRLDYQHHFGWQIEKFSRGKYDLETLGDNISLNKILEKYPELKNSGEELDLKLFEAIETAIQAVEKKVGD